MISSTAVDWLSPYTAGLKSKGSHAQDLIKYLGDDECTVCMM